MTFTKSDIFLVCVVVVLIIILFVSHIKRKRKIRKAITILDERYKISREFHGDTFTHCTSIASSYSTGILMDSAIVCHALKALPSTPFFYFEVIPEDGYHNGWFFPNLDITEFNKLEKDKNSPSTILCKTKQTYDILSKKFPGKNVKYTGFTSVDKYKPDIVKDYKKFIHVAGKSPYKNTQPLLETWLKHPEWPTLTIVCRDWVAGMCQGILFGRTQNNIKLITGYMSDSELVRMVNEYGIHICPSAHEGFGHYVNESRALKAVVLYTDCPPINEYFTDNVSGIAIQAEKVGVRNEGICPVYSPVISSLEESVNKVMNMSSEACQVMGDQARQDYILDDQKFKASLAQLVMGTRQTPDIIHYIWIGKDTPYENVKLPEKCEKYVASWKENNENFKFMYWSGKDILNLINSNLPQFLEFYMNIPNVISKADFARFAIVYVYGGMYTDVDFFCRKNVEPLLKCESYILFEPEEHCKLRKVNIASNGIFAFCPKNEFVLGWLEQMEKNGKKSVIENKNWNVMEVTGPYGFYDYVKNTPNNVNIGNYCRFLALTQDGNISEKCKGIYNNYACTVWDDGSGWATGDDKDSYQNGKFKYEINPIDGSQMLWEKSEYTEKLSPELSSNPAEKKEMFEKYKGVDFKTAVDIENAHIGDTAIPLALALCNIKRSDILIKAYEQDRDKCDFMEKMVLINHVPNIEIVNGSATSIKN